MLRQITACYHLYLKRAIAAAHVVHPVHARDALALHNAPQPLPLANGLNHVLQALHDLHGDFEAVGQVLCFAHGAEPALHQFTNRFEVERARVMVMRTQLAGGRQWTQRCEGVTEKEASFGVGR